jgi:hypothetical protein
MLFLLGSVIRRYNQQWVSKKIGVQNARCVKEKVIVLR